LVEILVDGKIGFGEREFLCGGPSGPLEIVGEFFSLNLFLDDGLGFDVDVLLGFVGHPVVLVVDDGGH